MNGPYYRKDYPKESKAGEVVWGCIMSATPVLDRLDKVKQTGPDRWVACCPAHDDKSPSLAVRELDDGRILIHDFGGCATTDVLAALGLELKDLYSEHLTTASLPGQRPNHWHASREALHALRQETLVVAIAAENVAGGITLSDDDRDRLILAASRIRATAEACA